MISKFINKQKVKRTEEKAFAGKKIYLFKVEIKITPKETCENVRIWMPFPRETPYQGVLENEFLPSEPKIFSDKDFGNKVACWSLNKPTVEEELLVGQKATVWVKPRVEEISGELDEYKKTDPIYKLYTQEDPYFNFAGSRIKRQAEKIAGREKKIEKVACKLYEYVRDELAYGGATEGLYSSVDALEKDKVDCGGFDCLLGSMYRSLGIPSRLVSGFLAGYPGEHYHAWLEFLTPQGEWVPVDPSVEHLRLVGRDFKPGGFGKIGNDRIAVSFGTDVRVTGKKFPLLQVPEVEVLPAGSASVERNVEALEVKR